MKPPTRSVHPNASHPARTWADIDLGKIARNVHALRRMVGASGAVMAVVKADAYGHGAGQVARTCVAEGTQHLAVATAVEANELRRVGIRADIYLLSPFLPEEAEAIMRADLIPLVSSPEQIVALAEAASRAPLPARCFLAIDTGMGREGCLLEEARALWRDAATDDRVRITGIATHFSSADEPDGDMPTTEQAAVFHQFVASLGPDALTRAEDGRGGQGVWLTLCNSPATLRLPMASLPPGVRGYLFRDGLLLYGIEPYRGAFAESAPDLEPVLSWRVRVTLLKDLPAGATIGYARTHTLARPSRIATLAVGYADGLSRRLSNQGQVLIGGQRFPLVGRVSMDQCQVDVTDAPSPVSLGDIATLIGTDGPETQTVLDLAEAIDTTPHEPTCALTHRVPRVYR
jgi:alanine racemase